MKSTQDTLQVDSTNILNLMPNSSIFVPAKGSKSLKSVSIDSHPWNIKKRKTSLDLNTHIDNVSDNITHAIMKRKVAVTDNTVEEWGFKWDRNSCAYDSMFSILYALYISHKLNIFSITSLASKIVN